MNYILPVKTIKYEGDVTNLDSLFTKKLLQIGIKENIPIFVG